MRMYPFAYRGALDFKYRSERILKEIEVSNSDIICLQVILAILYFQEVDHWNDFYGPNLEKLGYSAQLAYRREKDAVVIGYKTKVFELVKSEVVDYNDIADYF